MCYFAIDKKKDSAGNEMLKESKIGKDDKAASTESDGSAYNTIMRDNPVCQPKHEPTDFEITYKSGCLGERNAKANHSS